MSIRSLFGGLFIMLGCAAMALSGTAMLLSMQMQTGDGLLIGVAGLVGSLLSLLLGGVVLLYQR